MKILSVFQNGNEISLHNNMLGVEKIRYNGEQMSSIFSLFGAKHSFTVYENSERVDYIVKVGYSIWGVTANIFRNHEPIMLGLSNCAGLEKTNKHRSATQSELV